ncbi:MAG: biotin--[acetyl-CoA-carboxylase] ligase [Armatimonadetes bacterium]|nr:biotin--[acetyl-CoA-carboxylase] ligase [Armatimonadota bacterium]
MEDTLNAEAIRRGLGTDWLGRRIEVKAQTGSTNDDGVALARAGKPAGTVVVADHQTAGRGRRGRSWLAPPGTALLLSVVLRPDLPARAAGRLGLAAALSAADAIRGACGLAPVVKYPNDVLLEGRKVCGVLTEAHLSGGRVAWAVIGIGINVRRESVPPELAAHATSLEAHAAPPARNNLARALLASLETYLVRAADDPEALAAEWRDLDTVRGRQVSVAFGATRLEGFAADVDEDGRLLLRLPDGREERLSPEDVSFRGFS